MDARALVDVGSFAIGEAVGVVDDQTSRDDRILAPLRALDAVAGKVAG